MSGVDVHEWGPTELDEEAVLGRFFLADVPSGTFSFRVGSLLANSVAAALNQAQTWIGTKGRPNVFTREYASRHGSEFLSVSWCDIFQTYVSHHAPAPSVLPKGDRAFTPWHARDFDDLGKAYSGSAFNIMRFAKPGCVIFFDWNGSNTVDAVDHVGMVVHNLGDGRLVTVEGNTSDSVALRTRGADVIAVIGVPGYLTPPAGPVTPPKPVGDAWPYGPGVLMHKGWIHSAGVRKVQTGLNLIGYRPLLVPDGAFGAKTEAAVKWYQRRVKITVDGFVGPITWGRLFG